MTQRCPDCASGELLSGHGNGKCSACYGGGKVGTIADDVAGGKRNCDRCRGTGQCRTCSGTGVVAAVAPPKRPHADDEINPFDDKVAIRTVCPNCGALDWFEWKFLGRLKDPICSHSWYAGSGTYTLMQIRAAFAAGGKGAKYFTSGVSGEGAWIAKGMGWFMGVLLGLGIRLEFGVLMIPIQAFAGLFQAKKTTPDIVTRVVVLAITLAGLGILIHEAQHASRPQFQPSQPVGYVQALSPQSANTPSAPNTYQPAVRPSFDCGKARTRVELLICRDGRLANFEADMASTYHQTLNRLPQDAQVSLRREHLAWFKNYSRTCNRSANDVDRAACIEGFLSAHTAELKNRPQ